MEIFVQKKDPLALLVHETSFSFLPHQTQRVLPFGTDAATIRWTGMCLPSSIQGSFGMAVWTFFQKKRPITEISLNRGTKIEKICNRTMG